MKNANVTVRRMKSGWLQSVATQGVNADHESGARGTAHNCRSPFGRVLDRRLWHAPGPDTNGWRLARRRIMGAETRQPDDATRH